MTPLSPRLTALAALLARLLLATLFLLAGAEAGADLPAFGARLAADGLPAELSGFVFYFLIGAGLAMVAGLQMRLVALAMAGFCLASGAIAYGDLAQPTDMVMLLKNIALSGGYGFAALYGPGAWSLDGWLARRRTVAAPGAAPEAAPAALAC